MSQSFNTFADAVAFHGHSCPGLAIGFRAAVTGLEKLFGSRSQDEEMVAIVENDACGVDAVQLLTGCTFGKGNLVFRDYGKMAFTFFNRNTGKGVRVYVEPPALDEEEDSRYTQLKEKTNRTHADREEMELIKQKRIEAILELPEETLIKTSDPLEPMPQKARLFESTRCDSCGERVMETRMVKQDQLALCISCGRNHENN